MTKMDLEFEQSHELAAEVRVSRSDGSESSVRLRLLGYDGCEFEADSAFEAGEPISIHIYRMGSIRATVRTHSGRVVVADFDKVCPV